MIKDFVLVGGGYIYVLFLWMWVMCFLLGVCVIVINFKFVVVYLGMLFGFVVGYYICDELDIDFVCLVCVVNVWLVFGVVMFIDCENKLVYVNGCVLMVYDVVLIDVGIMLKMNELFGFVVYGIFVKLLEVFVDCWVVVCE